MKIFALSMLFAVAAVPSPDAPIVGVSSPEVSASALGFTEALAAELAGSPVVCTCTLQANSFPLSSGPFGNCSDTGGPLVSSLTEAVACTPPGSDDQTQCSVSGTITWTPGCIPCCGTAGCEWLSRAGSGSQARIALNSTVTATQFWVNCNSGALSIGASADCTGFGGPTTIDVVGEIRGCNGFALTCAGVLWGATKRFLCD